MISTHNGQRGEPRRKTNNERKKEEREIEEEVICVSGLAYGYKDVRTRH